MTPENLTRLRELASATRTEWHVANPATQAYCMSFGHHNSRDPEGDARAWLKDHHERFPGGRFANYEVVKVESQTELQRLAAELVGAYAAAPAVETKVALDEWFMKTEWVRKTLQPRDLGKHYADVLRERIDSLSADATRYAFLCAHPDWRFIEALCQQFGADSAAELKACMDRAIDAARDAELTNWEISITPSPTITWPKARDVGRLGDMSPSAHLRVGLDSDNDAYVSVWDEKGGASIEFCTPGSGGGKSSRTRMALIALMVAMEADNTDTPALDWWALRGSGKGGTA